MTYYQILGVSETASKSEIKAAFREKSKQFHPDYNKSPNADKIFRTLKEAYDILRDEKKRETYDTYLRLKKERSNQTEKERENLKTEENKNQQYDFTGNYYSILGIRPTATKEEIENAFVKAMETLYSTDRSRPDYAKRYAGLKKAYDILSNEKKKCDYDFYLKMRQQARQDNFRKEYSERGAKKASSEGNAEKKSTKKNCWSRSKKKLFQTIDTATGLIDTVVGVAAWISTLLLGCIISFIWWVVRYWFVIVIMFFVIKCAIK